MGKNKIESTLLTVFQCLFRRYGPQHWWPAEGPFEVMVGAILTQSTAWTNVEKGIANLKKAGVLSPGSLRKLSDSELADLIHPCGYYNAKAKKLKAFAGWFGSRYGDSLEEMCAVPVEVLRKELLDVYGIGEETADSILLYACSKPVFVIDAYTRRIVDCLGLQPGGRNYRDYQALFMENLPHDVRLFNEFHALLVVHGKLACRKKNPVCSDCNLRDFCRRTR